MCKTYLDLGCPSAVRGSASAHPSAWPSTCTPHSSSGTFVFKLLLSSPLCSCHTERMVMHTGIKETRNDGQFNIINYEITPVPCRAVSVRSLWVCSSQGASAAGASEKHFAVCAPCFLTGTVCGHP